MILRTHVHYLNLIRFFRTSQEGKAMSGSYLDRARAALNASAVASPSLERRYEINERNELSPTPARKDSAASWRCPCGASVIAWAGKCPFCGCTREAVAA